MHITKLFATATLVGASTLAGFASAEPPADLDKTLALLKQRIDAIEKQLHAAPAPSTACATPDGLKCVMSSLDAKIYGFVRAEMNYFDKRGDYVDAPARVYDIAGASADNNAAVFSGTARFTRLGIQLSGPEVCGGKTSALIEGDFNGDSTTSQGSIKPRLRKAYIDWVKDDWSMRAGQDFDLIYSVGPDTVNQNGLWWNGMVGTRHVMAVLGKAFKVNDENKLELKIAAVRASGLLELGSSSSGTSNAGSPSGQASLTWKTTVFTKAPARFVVAGGAGKERYTVTGTAPYSSTYLSRSRHIASRIGTFGIELPVTDWMTIKAFGFMGRNIANYYGGIGQDLSSVQDKGLRSRGGYLQAKFKPTSKISLVIGGGMDKPKYADVIARSASSVNGVQGTANITGLTKNSTIYASIGYDFTSQFTVAFELNRLTTKEKCTDADYRKHTTGGILAATYKF